MDLVANFRLAKHWPVGPSCRCVGILRTSSRETWAGWRNLGTRHRRVETGVQRTALALIRWFGRCLRGRDGHSAIRPGSVGRGDRMRRLDLLHLLCPIDFAAGPVPRPTTKANAPQDSHCSVTHGIHGMATHRELRVLVATDGSRHAQAAIATTLHFPWPVRTCVRAITARRTRAEYWRSILLTALDRGAAELRRIG